MFEKKKKSVIMASITGLSVLLTVGMASALANQSHLKVESREELSLEDFVISKGAVSTGVMDLDLVAVFELQDRIADKIFQELSVDSTVAINGYEANPMVVAFLNDTNLENHLEFGTVEKIIREMMSDWDRVDIVIDCGCAFREASYGEIDFWGEGVLSQMETTGEIDDIEAYLYENTEDWK